MTRHYIEAAHSNPFRRVTPGREQVYDKENYREMLLEAAEKRLGYFGFDRKVYGDTGRKKERKWWHTLRDERTKD